MKQSDLPEDIWQLSGMTKGLRILFNRSVLLNNFAEQKEKYNFQSILIAFMLCDDYTSQWFQKYIESGTQFQNMISFFLSGKPIEKLREIPPDDKLADPSGWTQTAKMGIMGRAIELKSSTAKSSQNPLDVRHIMGAYIYYKDIEPSDDHKSTLKKWGFDLYDWSNEFLKHIKSHFEMELDRWKDIHSEIFAEEMARRMGGASSHI